MYPDEVVSVLPGQFAEALAQFAVHLEAERGRSPHTVKAYLADVGLLLATAAAGGVDTLDGLTLATLRRWLGSMSEAGLSRSTLARRASSARAFTSWACRTGRMDTDPGVRLATPKQPRHLPVVLRSDESAALRDLATVRADDADPSPLRHRAALELLYATGVGVT